MWMMEDDGGPAPTAGEGALVAAATVTVVVVDVDGVGVAVGRGGEGTRGGVRSGGGDSVPFDAPKSKRSAPVPPVVSTVSMN